MSGPRVFAFNVAFVGLTVGLGLLGLVVRTFRRDQAFALARLWISLTLALLRKVCAVRIDVRGHEHLGSGPLIVASQHRSALDALIWFTIVSHPTYVMKQELTRIPLIGPLLGPAGMIAVDRAGGSRALRRMVRDAAGALAGGRQLIIFPEGTRVASGAPAALLAPGIAALAGLGAPILPVVTDSDRVWGGGFLLRPSRSLVEPLVHIVIAPPLPGGLDRDALRREIRAAWTRSENYFA